MKTPILLVTLGLFAGFLSAEPASAGEVNFVDTDNFTDFSDSYSFLERGRESIINEITRFLENRAESRLKAGEKLTIVITDVDMAGEFEPWRGSSAQDVRIVKDLYPPRIDLSFRLTNEAGTVISEGNRKLRDMGFMYTVRASDRDPLRYEKDLLARWLSKELRRGSSA
ncbi:MAG: DUF3016 domain-containing protein [Candidatus Synoicihabitans palmerolidicus]|nr:DUF3016 domain-containing protein [Candidatus Synoicihabitans palmerolidicus]